MLDGASTVQLSCEGEQTVVVNSAAENGGDTVNG